MVINVWDNDLAEQLDNFADQIFDEMADDNSVLEPARKFVRAEVKRQLVCLGLRVVLGLDCETARVALKASENWEAVIQRDAEEALTKICRQEDPDHPEVHLPETAPCEA